MFEQVLGENDSHHNLSVSNKLTFDDDDTSSLYSKFSKINIDLNKEGEQSMIKDVKIVNDERRKLSSSIWTKEEDILLLKLSQSKLKNRWKKISKLIGTKCQRQCSYRMKFLSQTKIDPDSPKTSKELKIKINLDALNEKNEKNEKSDNIEKTIVANIIGSESNGCRAPNTPNNKSNKNPTHINSHNSHNNNKNAFQLKTNADKKNRNLGVKLSNVTKLFGIIKKESDSNVNVASKSTVNSLMFQQPTNKKVSNSSLENADSPFNPKIDILRKSSPLDIQLANKTSKDMETEESFKKEYFKTFENQEKQYESYNKDHNSDNFASNKEIKNPFKNCKNNINIVINPNEQTINNNNDLTNITQEELIKLFNQNNWKTRVNEIQCLINSTEFNNQSQLSKMTHFSQFLVEINLYRSKLQSTEEEQLCMEVQSNILQSMIENTQKQLITDDGEKLLA